MNQHIVSRIAIYILALVMIIFGIQHFIHPYDLLVKVPDFLPGGIVWVYFAGVAFILAALSFITNIWVKTAAYLLALLLFIFVLGIHLPNFMDTADPTYRQMSLYNLLKDSALAAFALYIASNARHQRILEDVEPDERVMRVEK
ncbi:MAG: DoxX family protein [Bacteroidota bacterium]